MKVKIFTGKKANVFGMITIIFISLYLLIFLLEVYCHFVSF